MKFLERLQQRKQDIANKVQDATDFVIKETTQVATMVTNTVVDAIKENIIDPIIETDQEIVDKRFNTCLACDKFNHSSQRCNECGCFMQVKTKFKHVTCPLNKW
jgi:hypothetical protein